MELRNSSMQLTRAADYAVRVMVHLARLPADRRVALLGLAVATGAPESFLSKVLQALSRSLLIVSRRGQAGGFAISTLGRNASMRQVIEAVDGPIQLNVCVGRIKACGRQAICPAHPVWEKAQRAMLEVLEAASIADMASREVQAPATSFDSVSLPMIPDRTVRLCEA